MNDHFAHLLVRARRALLAACAAASLLTAGCAGAKPEVQEPEGGAGSGFPVAVTDDTGQAVRVEREPRRIVSTSPTGTEMLFAIGVGDRVVAVTDQCNYPPAVTDLPRMGLWFTPSVEKALAAEPDLVLGSRGNPQEFLAALRRSGCPVFTMDPKTLEGILVAIRQVGRLTGARAAAEKLVGEMQDRLTAVAERLESVPEEERPSAFIFLGLNPVWTAGLGTFQDDAIRASGGRNLAGDREGFTPYSTEVLMSADPDYLLLSTMEGDPDRMRREVLANPVLKQLSAAREGRIIVLEADPIMRPGPRIVEAVEAMARAFYPDRFDTTSGGSGLQPHG